MHNKNIFTIVLSLLFLGTYFVVYSQISKYIQLLVEKGAEIAAAVKSAFIPAYWMGTAIADTNVVSLLLYALVTLIPFALIYCILSHSFIRIVTTKRGAARVKYDAERESSVKSNSIMSALIKRELRRFSSSAVYMMNSGMGIIMTFIFGVFIIFAKGKLGEMFAGSPIDIALLTTSGVIMPILCVAICAVTAMSYISAPSISLEGKTLWVIRTTPVDSGDILMAKAYAHIILTEPAALFASVVACIVFKASPLMWVLTILAPLTVNVLAALLGVIINLKAPRFDWINETVVIKQSLSTMIAMFGMWGIIAAPVLLYVFLLAPVISAELFTLIMTVVFTAVSFLLARYIKTRGKAIFENF